jgi:hypothetical protein
MGPNRRVPHVVNEPETVQAVNGLAMLASEWQELQQLTDRIAVLRDRYRDAQRMRQAGLMAGLRQEIARAQAARQQLLRHVAITLAHQT